MYSAIAAVRGWGVTRRGTWVAAWCGRRDLNPHDFRHGNLNPARLPVPPRPRRRQPTCAAAGRRGLYHGQSTRPTTKIGAGASLLNCGFSGAEALRPLLPSPHRHAMTRTRPPVRRPPQGGQQQPESIQVQSSTDAAHATDNASMSPRRSERCGDMLWLAGTLVGGNRVGWLPGHPRASAWSWQRAAISDLRLEL